MTDAQYLSKLPSEILRQMRYSSGWIHRPNASQRKALGRGRFAATYRRQGGLCAICHGWFTIEQMTRDHIVPRSKGGSPQWNNIQLTCGPCNAAKGDQ